MLQSRVTNFTFPARRSTTIRTVKEKLADFTGHAATHQRVLARGFELKNIDRVGSRTALHVVPHSPPRPPNILTEQVQTPATSCLCVSVRVCHSRVSTGKCMCLHAYMQFYPRQTIVGVYRATRCLGTRKQSISAQGATGRRGK